MSPRVGFEPTTCRLTADRSANGALEAMSSLQRRSRRPKTPTVQKNKPTATSNTLLFIFIFLSIEEVCGTKNSAVYSMRGTLQYRFTTARVQWPCSTDIHWACLITQSGPARYVTIRHLWLDIEWPKLEINLRVRTTL